MRRRKEERTTPSGIVVVEELTEADKKKAPEEVRQVQKSPWVTKHKLPPEDRKQRRADNKAMKEIRQKTRGRKKHGRSR